LVGAEKAAVDKKTEFGIILTRGDEVYRFKAANEKDQNLWIYKINDAIQACSDKNYVPKSSILSAQDMKPKEGYLKKYIFRNHKILIALDILERL
jgi:hypothetical protein